MAGRKSDFTLPTLDDLFSSEEERQEQKLAKIRDIPIELIDDFPQHPFKVRDDEDTLILLPERMQGSETFIKLAIEASELYELDTRITRKDDSIEVTYSFDCGGDMAFLIPVFRMADSISFFTGIYGFEITISLDYYTHAVYLREKLIHPQDFSESI